MSTMMSKAYASMSREELLSLKEELDKEFQGYKEKGLKLDMSRGKPSIAQLNLSMGMMDVLSSSDDLTCEDGTDCRKRSLTKGTAYNLCVNQPIKKLEQISQKYRDCKLQDQFDRLSFCQVCTISFHFTLYPFLVFCSQNK